MGAWGNGVWQDDAAYNMLLMFDDLLETGAIPTEAVHLVILHPPWGWGDWDDEPVQILALAALALEYVIFTPALRNWAMAALGTGAPLDCWTESNPEDIAHRAGVLERFKAMLQQGTTTAEELESVTRPQEFSLW
jgi:hypothetical protein